MTWTDDMRWATECATFLGEAKLGRTGFGVLRFHFDGPDFGRVVLRRPNPMWELTLSLHVLANGSHRPDLQAWRLRASRKLEVMGMSRDVRQLMCLAPEAPYFPDFLTPDADSLQCGLRMMAATPVATLHGDLEQLAEMGTVPVIATSLASVGAMEQLLVTLAAYYNAVVAPTWRRVVRLSEQDRDWRSAVLGTRGVFALLASFEPAVMSFSDPVLRVKSPEGDVQLGGRGLALVPSYFCRSAPVSNRHFRGQPSVVYQVGLGCSSLGGHSPSDERSSSPSTEAALVKLLGSSRTAVLSGLRDPASTTSLAASLGLAASTVSAHLGVLHAAGLIVKQRHEHEVLYWLTAQGRTLIRHS